MNTVDLIDLVARASIFVFPASACPKLSAANNKAASTPPRSAGRSQHWLQDAT